jgi:dihydroorotate dehydrogenase
MHALGQEGLRVLGRPELGRLVHPRPLARLATRCLGLSFESPLGLAAGFDKGEVNVGGLFALGFSHVEIGTITPRPQPGNPPPRLFRLVEQRAIVNRMGFNNGGADATAARLAALPPSARGGVLGVNVGRNKDTPNERAEEDYLLCIEKLHSFADYLVVNISSPNTPGLRALQERTALERLLGRCVEKARGLAQPKPLLVKLAPDLDDAALDEAVEVAISARASGLIATNTTVSRPSMVAGHPYAAEAGGLSGMPLEPLATAVVRRAALRARGRIPIIGVGGVMSAADAYAKIRAGASLVQVYTGFIYGGPAFPRDVLAGLDLLLARDGFARVEDAVGADHRAPQVSVEVSRRGEGSRSPRRGISRPTERLQDSLRGGERWIAG